MQHTDKRDEERYDDSDDFLDSLRKGLLLGAAALALILPPVGGAFKKSSPPAAQTAAAVQAPNMAKAGPQATAVQPVKGLAPDFNGQTPSDEVFQLASWTMDSGDHKNMSFAIVDKKQAHVWVFRPDGKLTASTPALMGAAHGDHTVPGIGTKPIALITPEERTTPAGRFVAEMGINATHEDVVWVDYDAAVSMHRVRPLVKSERRLERLASATPDDNRISWGCINLPPAFYEGVLRPAVKTTGVVIYILPEVKTPQEVFASYYEVPKPGQASAQLIAARTLADVR